MRLARSYPLQVEPNTYEVPATLPLRCGQAYRRHGIKGAQTVARREVRRCPGYRCPCVRCGRAPGVSRA